MHAYKCLRNSTSKINAENFVCIYFCFVRRIGYNITKWLKWVFSDEQSFTLHSRVVRRVRYVMKTVNLNIKRTNDH